MKKKSTISAIIIDMFIKILSWSIWYIAILTILHIVLVIIGARIDIDFITTDLFTFSYPTISVSVFVMSIIGNYTFMPFYIKHGVTRKEYFMSNTVVGLGLSVSTTFIFLVLGSIEKFFIKDIITNTSMKPIGIYADKNPLIILFVVILSVFLFYLLGWIIHIGYYRFGWIVGFLFIGFVILVSYIFGLFWGEALFNITDNVSVITGSNGVSLLGTIVLIGCVLIIIRLLTRRITIKL